MPSIWGLTGGVNTKQKTLQGLMAGVNTKMKTGYGLIGGVNTKVFSSIIEWTHSTYNSSWMTTTVYASTDTYAVFFLLTASAAGTKSGSATFTFKTPINISSFTYKFASDYSNLHSYSVNIDSVNAFVSSSSVTSKTETIYYTATAATVIVLSYSTSRTNACTTRLDVVLHTSVGDIKLSSADFIDI